MAKLTRSIKSKLFNNFFSRVDADGDGFVTAAEADKQLKRMQARSKKGGRPNGAGQAGGPAGAGRAAGVSQ